MGLMNTMNTKKLSKAYWDKRHQLGDTPWDIGEAAPAIIEYFSNRPLNGKSMLIPGAGLAHEARVLASRYKDAAITILDISPTLIEYLKDSFANHKNIKLVCGDFFDHEMTYDYIIEQTFFCALGPDLRLAYFKKMHDLLNPGGVLAGLWFHWVFDKIGPPFGGDVEEYVSQAKTFFNEYSIDYHPKSILPRKDREVFLQFAK